VRARIAPAGADLSSAGDRWARLGGGGVRSASATCSAVSVMRAIIEGNMCSQAIRVLGWNGRSARGTTSGWRRGLEKACK
jgi:hypothetical protein